MAADVGVRFVPSLMSADLRRSSFLRRLARRVDMPVAGVDIALPKLKSELVRADMEPLSWLKLVAPPSARGLIDQIENDARAQRVSVEWALLRPGQPNRAWRYGDRVGLVLEHIAGCRRPVAMMLFYLFHELAHDPYFAGPGPNTSAEAFGRLLGDAMIRDEVRVRRLEPAFLDQIHLAGVEVDAADLCPFSVRLWQAAAAGQDDETLGRPFAISYGQLDPAELTRIYLTAYAHHDANRMLDAATVAGPDLRRRVRGVIADSPAFARAGAAGRLEYAELVLDRLSGSLSRRALRRVRRTLMAELSTSRVSAAAGALEPTCKSLL